MWRNHLSDVGLLYSLVDDLQAFWQLKALEWDKLSRKILQIAEEEKRSHTPVTHSPDDRLLEILEHNDDYRTLRDRLEIELRSAVEIAHFLGYPHIRSIQQLAFHPPLPPNEPLEAAISEAEALAHYAEKSRYWWWAIIATIRQLGQQGSDR